MERAEVRQVVSFEDRSAALVDRTPLDRALVDVRDLSEQLVATEADLRSQQLEGNAAPMTPKRIEPRVSMRVVAVEQGSIDVEQYGSDPRHGSPSTLPYAVDVPADPPNVFHTW